MSGTSDRQGARAPMISAQFPADLITFIAAELEVRLAIVQGEMAWLLAARPVFGHGLGRGFRAPRKSTELQNSTIFLGEGAPPPAPPAGVPGGAWDAARSGQRCPSACKLARGHGSARANADTGTVLAPLSSRAAPRTGLRLACACGSVEGDAGAETSAKVLPLTSPLSDRAKSFGTLKRLWRKAFRILPKLPERLMSVVKWRLRSSSTGKSMALVVLFPSSPRILPCDLRPFWLMTLLAACNAPATKHFRFNTSATDAQFERMEAECDYEATKSTAAAGLDPFAPWIWRKIFIQCMELKGARYVGSYEAAEPSAKRPQ